MEILIGSQLAIYKDRLAKDFPQLILGIMSAFVGVVFICVSVYNLLKSTAEKVWQHSGCFL